MFCNYLCESNRYKFPFETLGTLVFGSWLIHDSCFFVLVLILVSVLVSVSALALVVVGLGLAVAIAFGLSFRFWFWFWSGLVPNLIREFKGRFIRFFKLEDGAKLRDPGRDQRFLSPPLARWL